VHSVFKKTANLFLSELSQIFINFNNFWQKEDTHFPPHLTGVTTTMLNADVKVLQNAESCYLQ